MMVSMSFLLLAGMGAPYWRPDARGLITGLTRDSNWQSLVRATVESVAYQSYDLFNAMNKDGLKPRIVKIDGGMVANNWFSQFLSDTINLKVIRPKSIGNYRIRSCALCWISSW